MLRDKNKELVGYALQNVFTEAECLQLAQSMQLRANVLKRMRTHANGQEYQRAAQRLDKAARALREE